MGHNNYQSSLLSRHIILKPLTGKKDDELFDWASIEIVETLRILVSTHVFSAALTMIRSCEGLKMVKSSCIMNGYF
jgi:hypothetical protein